jgi:hypothetical protein
MVPSFRRVFLPAQPHRDGLKVAAAIGQVDEKRATWREPQLPQRPRVEGAVGAEMTSREVAGFRMTIMAGGGYDEFGRGAAPLRER